MLKFFAVLSSILKRSNYFDGPTKLFSDLYLDKFFFLRFFDKIVFIVLIILRNIFQVLFITSIYEKKCFRKNF